MTGTRPCTCDRFAPGRPFVVDRDCDKCWLYAHQPSIRKAWGGDPDDCDSLFVARPTMAAAELADLLEGPALLMPVGWRLWPIMRTAHLILADRFVAGMPAYPEGKFSGRGAVICGGGIYEAGAYVACQMLRLVGWRHPIEVWHRGRDEPVSDRIRRLPGVSVINTEAHPARPSRRTMGGWESKSFAIINSSFEEVLFLDGDSYPICNPEICFEPQHNPHGIVTWPDADVVDQSVQWKTYGLEPDGRTPINGGHYVFSKRRAWRVLQLAAHFDNHSDYYYFENPNGTWEVGGLGDQDQMRAAIHKLGAPSHRYTDRPLMFGHLCFLQAGPLGRPMFVHRYCNKFAWPDRFPTPPRWNPSNLPMEATAWRLFLEWLTTSTDAACFPEEVPGWFTLAECQLWSETCKDRQVLELGRYHGRSTVVAARAAQLVVSIDRGSAVEADYWLQRYGLGHKVWLRAGEFAALVPSSGGPFDACLINAAHDSENVKSDIAIVRPHLSAEAVIGFHNYGDPTFAGVQETIDAAAQRFGWRLIGKADCLAVFAIGAGPKSRSLDE